VHPMLTAMMSKETPENAQGELQGGISSIMAVTMLLGTVFFAQIFGFFLQPDAPIISPNMAFFVSGALLIVTLVLFIAVRNKHAPLR
jgi:DHA1 family tetracycline resistance protein-like MFS transporter